MEIKKTDFSEILDLLSEFDTMNIILIARFFLMISTNYPIFFKFHQNKIFLACVIENLNLDSNRWLVKPR